jgi:hypothetical protein
MHYRKKEEHEEAIQEIVKEFCSFGNDKNLPA